MRKILILILPVMTFLAAGAVAGEHKDFIYYDSVTYRLYEEKRWKELAEAGREALDEGYDYYYMRMRTGIALFELRNFLTALRHFEKARGFNSLSHDPLLYKYYCYAAMGWKMRALETLHLLPEKIREDIPDLPSQSVYVEGGYEMSPSAVTGPAGDLDGGENIFGEATFPDNDRFITLGYRFLAGSRATIHLAATVLNGEWLHRAMASDQVILNEKIFTEQYEGYFSVRLNPGKGFYIQPAFHLIGLTYDHTSVRYYPATDLALFTPGRATFNDEIAFLSVERSAGRFVFSLSGAYSTILGGEQYQAAAGIVWFPMGNRDIYFDTKLIAHINDRDPEWIFSQKIGYRITERLWSEAYATIGRMENYHENYGYTVYNTGYPLEFKGGTRFFLFFAKSFTFILNYHAIRSDQYIIRYKRGQGPLPPQPGTLTFECWDHSFSGGLIWDL